MPTGKQVLEIRYTIGGQSTVKKVAVSWPEPVLANDESWADFVVDAIEEAEGVYLLLNGKPYYTMPLGDAESVQPIAIETTEENFFNWTPYLGRWEYIRKDELKGPTIAVDRNR
ncbi:hypothetical protein [Pseudomonas luteola]|uniref:hypothetical protein n=1 Tax=Pseudomonas luteola TaxID=47886 RepID=UPI000F78257A|nr:hypothetical protein [Pseudomonas luteola]